MSKSEPKHADFCQDGLFKDFIFTTVTGCISLPIYVTFIPEEAEAVLLLWLLRDLARTLVVGLDITIVVSWIGDLMVVGAIQQLKELLSGKVIY